MASGLSCPVGFKNGTDGSLQIAIDAMNAARHSHSFLSVTKEGKSAIFNTAGNDDCHIIHRGGNNKSNFKMQSKVVDNVKDQLLSGEKNIIGIMLESNLEEGNQKIASGDKLKYGQSITDSCIGWKETEDIILGLDDTLRRAYEN